MKPEPKDDDRWTLVPIFNDEYSVIVVFGSTTTVSICLYEWEYPDNDFAYVERHVSNKRGVCFYAERCHPVIAMPRRPRNSEEWGTLAHEACHAVEYIFKAIRQPTEDEVFAHAVGAVVRIGGRLRK